MPQKFKPRPVCLMCPNAVKRPESKYCSRACMGMALNQRAALLAAGDPREHAVNTAVSLRNFLKRRDGEKCSQCGWAEQHPVTGKVPVELDHIDGDHTNNALVNLRLLCPNCHSLTVTYKGLNRGRGRKARYADAR